MVDVCTHVFSLKKKRTEEQAPPQAQHSGGAGITKDNQAYIDTRYRKSAYFPEWNDVNIFADRAGIPQRYVAILDQNINIVEGRNDVTADRIQGRFKVSLA